MHPRLQILIESVCQGYQLPSVRLV